MKMAGKNIEKVKVEETEDSTSSTSLIFNPKDGKWQRPLSANSDSTSDSELYPVFLNQTTLTISQNLQF